MYVGSDLRITVNNNNTVRVPKMDTWSMRRDNSQEGWPNGGWNEALLPLANVQSTPNPYVPGAPSPLII